MGWPPMPADKMSPDPPVRKRPKWLFVVAGAVVIVLVAGILIWAPWHKVPVAPAAVHGQSPTATSVLVSWTPSKGGATIDRYLVLRNDAQVGSVAAGETSFLDNGLTPGTAYRYTIVAESGTQRSSPSVKAVVTTIAPSPVGLAASQQTWTTVTFHWSPSPKGPAPDSYVIYGGGDPVATVPGSANSYSVTGLSPGTAYQYQVTAKWGNHESVMSQALSLSTLAVPLEGSIPIVFKTVSTPGTGASLHVGQKWNDTWNFTSACTSTKCTLTADAEFAPPGLTPQPFTVTLNGSGSRYSGTTKAEITQCQSINVHNTVSLTISPDHGGVTNGGWTSWTGTMVLTSPYVTASGGYFCPSQNWNFAITGTHS
jgi:Fibronectin type III domain